MFVDLFHCWFIIVVLWYALHSKPHCKLFLLYLAIPVALLLQAATVVPGCCFASIP